MARRVTSPSKKQPKAQTDSSATLSEVAGAHAPSRGRKAKSTIAEPTEPSLTDALFPDADESTETRAELGSGRPAKARRGRRPKVQSDREILAFMGADDGIATKSASPEPTLTSDDEASYDQPDRGSTPSPSPRTDRRRRSPQSDGQPAASLKDSAAEPPAQQAAARWDADTGMAVFDWPSIEQVAAAGGPNQAMAKLLLAARAEGANSRWPF